MTIGIKRLTVAEPVEVKRVKPGPRGGHEVVWDKGARFSHYTPQGWPVVTHPSGQQETFANAEDVKPCS